MSPSSLRLALGRSRQAYPRLFARCMSHAPPSLEELTTEMPKREPATLVSRIPAEAAAALEKTLSSFIPESWRSKLGDYARKRRLPPAHHLVYFNPVRPAHELLPDGTDLMQSPGEPFVRRMWAGGYVRFKNPEEDGENALGYERYGVCKERIRDVNVKGMEGKENVFVGIERRFFSRDEDDEEHERIRGSLLEDDPEEMGDASVVEKRYLVFMRERSPEEAKAAVEKSKTKILKPQHNPDFEHTFVPTQSLLFRYSALTFNAHRIHLDPEYCRTVEGYRDLLFHGPLSLTMLLTLLDNQLPEANTYIERMDYRNLAPLYCNEPVRLCGRQIKNDAKSGRGWKYDLWVETPAGGMAVKATATVKSC